MSFLYYDGDDDLIRAAEEERRPQLRVCCPQSVQVVLGRGSRVEDEVDLDRCRADGVPVRRRRGGGCAVVIDPGNVIVSLALPVSGLGNVRKDIRRLSSWLIAGLAPLGATDLVLAGTSDLAIGDRKVGGSCVYRNRAVLFYSASLLVDADLSLIARYLRHPPREPDYRRGREHHAFVGRLPQDRWATAAAWAEALASKLVAPETETAYDARGGEGQSSHAS